MQLSEDYAEEIEFAMEAVRTAGLLTRKIQSELAGNEIQKEDKSPVTVGDFSAQAVIGMLMAQHFPEDELVAEESSEVLRSCEASEGLIDQVLNYVAPYCEDLTQEKLLQAIDQGATGEMGARFWTLDPIDGTKGFIRGDQYAVGMSLIENGQVTMGIIGCPNLKLKNQQGIIAVALKGKGCWITSMEQPGAYERLSASDRDNPKTLRMLRSVEASHTNFDRTANILNHLGVEEEPIAMDSQAKYVLVAAGEGEVFFYLLPQKKPEFRMKIWDVAPGAIVVEEAGGQISDIEGNPLDFSMGKTMAKNPGLLITNGKLHSYAVEAIRKSS